MGSPQMLYLGNSIANFSSVNLPTSEYQEMLALDINGDSYLDIFFMAYIYSIGGKICQNQSNLINSIQIKLK